MSQRPAFLITIDTEGDNCWLPQAEPTTENSRFIPRFQELCETFGFQPTYLTNWEMVNDLRFQEFGSDALGRGTAEIGMHLHAWHQPPMAHGLTSSDWRHQPYLIEYPETLLREKVKRLTGRLEDAFQIKMTSHRAGRWAFDVTYAQALVDEGYLVDCSVTPHVSWAQSAGAPGGAGGTDYRSFPDQEYFLAPDDISRPGQSSLLEVPLTILVRRNGNLTRWLRPRLPSDGVIARGLDRWSLVWLRPNGRNLSDMLWILEAAAEEGRRYVEFMLHSSELMPAGSPTFPDARDIDQLFDDLAALFSKAADLYEGATLSHYRQRHNAR